MHKINISMFSLLFKFLSMKNIMKCLCLLYSPYDEFLIEFSTDFKFISYFNNPCADDDSKQVD